MTKQCSTLQQYILDKNINNQFQYQQKITDLNGS